MKDEWARKKKKNVAQMLHMLSISRVTVFFLLYVSANKQYFSLWNWIKNVCHPGLNFQQTKPKSEISESEYINDKITGPKTEP